MGKNFVALTGHKMLLNQNSMKSINVIWASSIIKLGKLEESKLWKTLNVSSGHSDLM